ncbi:MAG TPA: hypothetical protein VH020_15090 [Stellaceae bacterium]|jgi:hypothetical protein|nr:hypothetical protein [Stellaceae bacterium]
MKFASRFLFLGMLLAGALAPAFAFGADGRLIEAGRGIGAAALGMSVEQAMTALGKPDAKYHVTDGHLYLFGGLQLFAAEGGRVHRIETDSADYRTRQGLGVGSMESEIVAALGKPALAENIDTRNDNLLMTIGRRLCYEPGLVFIADYAPRQPHAITRVAVRGDGCARAFGN